MTNQHDTFVCLVVEDDPDEVEFLNKALLASQESRFDLHIATTLAEAHQQAQSHEIHLIVLDLNLPDSRGFDTFIHFHEQHFNLPIVVITGFADQALALRAIRMGAQDYIEKGMYKPELTARAMRFAIERHRIMLAHLGQSMHDDLTNLYNRRGFIEFASKQLCLSIREEKDLILIYTDLDNLKQVNDSLGHEVGDQLICDTANILKRVLRGTDICARIGGDEMVAMALGASAEYTSIIITRIMRSIQDFNLMRHRPYLISISLGVASFDHQNPISLDELLHQADQAMYMDKRSHKP